MLYTACKLQHLYRRRDCLVIFIWHGYRSTTTGRYDWLWRLLFLIVFPGDSSENVWRRIGEYKGGSSSEAIYILWKHFNPNFYSDKCTVYNSDSNLRDCSLHFPLYAICLTEYKAFKLFFRSNAICNLKFTRGLFRTASIALSFLLQTDYIWAPTKIYCLKLT